MSCYGSYAPMPASQEDFDMGEILSKAQKVLKDNGKTSQGWYDPFGKAAQDFEQADNPKVEYDFEVKEVPIIDSLMTLISVTTFLAGFMAADFSGFAFKDWEDFHWAVPCIYILLMAFSEGACLYLSICGTMAGVAYYRAKNQLNMGEWEAWCQQAIEPLSADLQSLKGNRLKAYAAAYTAILLTDEDYYRNLLLGRYIEGKNFSATKLAEGLLVDPGIIRVRRAAAPQTYLLSLKDPACLLGNRLGFRYVKQYTLCLAVVSYIIAQTSQALRGAPPNIIAVVVAIVGYWLVQVGFDLRKIYDKLEN